MTSFDILYCILELRLNHYIFYATSILFENECPSSVHRFKQSALSLEEFEISLKQPLWRCLVCYESSLILLKCSSAVHVPMIFCILEITVISLNNQITPKCLNSLWYKFCSWKCHFLFYIQRMFFFSKISIFQKTNTVFFIICGKISPILFIIRISSSFAIIHVFAELIPWLHA